MSSGTFRQPTGIAVAPDGNAYVADELAQRVNVFSPSGEFLFAFGHEVNADPLGDPFICTTECQIGETGEIGGALYNPVGVAVDDDGLVYVSEQGNDRISVFGPDGQFVRLFGWEVTPGGANVCTVANECESGSNLPFAGALYEPLGIAIGDDGLLYIADSGNSRASVFTRAGVFVRSFAKGVNQSGSGDPDLCTPATPLEECAAGETGGAAGVVELPEAVAVGPAGEVAVADSANHRIAVFTAAGAFVRAFGKSVNPGAGDPDVCDEATTCQAANVVQGEEPGGLDHPSALATAPSGSLYVADITLNRVAEFGFDGSFVRAFGANVRNGDPEFQICTEGTGCQGGAPAEFEGATPDPRGLAFDCRGALYVSASKPGEFARVERFGEAGTATPPCEEPEPEPGPSPGAEPINAIAPLPEPVPGISFAGLRLDRKSGRAFLFVRVTVPGRVVLRGRGVKPMKRVAGRPGRGVRLLVLPKPGPKRLLRRRGKASIRVDVSLKPFSGPAPEALGKRIVLKRKRVRRNRG